MAIKHHWGEYHPHLITLYTSLAYSYLKKGGDQIFAAQKLYEAALKAASASLGDNHIKTAAVKMDYGRLCLKKGSKQEALTYFVNAHSIYNDFLGKSALDTGHAAFQIAKLYEEQREFKLALEYASSACEIYQQYYAEAHEMRIFALWHKVCVLYTLRAEGVKVDSTVLYQVLLKRDQLIEEE